MYAFCQPFSIITDLTTVKIGSGSATNLPGGRFQFSFSVPGALQGAVLASTNLLNWEVLQMVPLTSSIVIFTDESATNFPHRFYRLRVP